jgi:hypothetical protein
MWRLNAGALTAQNLLEMHGCPSAKELAYRWVAEINAEGPDLFNGRLGSHPHKISVAAMALGHGLQTEPRFDHYAMEALTTLTFEVARNGRSYGFSRLDLRLLDAADGVFLDHLPTRDPAAA